MYIIALTGNKNVADQSARMRRLISDIFVCLQQKEVVHK